MKNIIKLSNDLFLNEQKVNNTTKETVKVNSPVNHILVIDVSGSMSYELTKIRKQLINKLPNLVNDKDTVTIIWFSGKNECGILKEEVEIKSLKDLSDLNKAIERFLQPIGLTGFVNPLKLVTDVVDRISKNRPDSVFSMLFLTDGYDNQSSETEILKVVKLLEPMLNSCVFVEYGYYCNRNLLSKMAELVGGVNIFSEGFDSYDPVFEKQITKTIKSSKKIKVNLPNVLFNFVFSVDKTDNSITTYKVENNEILINENVDSVFYLTDTQDINSTIITINDELNSIYALLYCLSIRMKSDEIYKVLAILGDVELITFYINAFGKQNITTFQQMCLDVVNKIKQPYALGYVPNLVPKEDVYSLIDLFNDLNDDENNLWYPHNENFVYKRISSERIQKSKTLSEDEIKRISDLTKLITEAKDPSKITDLVNELTELQNNKFELKFEYKDKTRGYKLNDLVYNSSRPNLSVRVCYQGSIKLPKNEHGLEQIDTYKYNTYTFIKDGLLNVTKLPVSINETLFNKLKLEKVISNDLEYMENDVYVLDLSVLPIINRKMVKQIYAKELFEKSFELTKLKAKQKVYNHYESLHFPKESQSFKEKYGETCTAWLTTLGISDYNGFAPPTTDKKIGETYVAKEVDVKISGLSSLPTVNDVLKKLNDKSDKKKPLTLREELLAVAIKDYLDFTESDIYLTNENKEELLETWLKNKKKFIVSKTRELNNDLSKIKFGLILSQKWFVDLDSIEDNQMTLNIDGKDISFEVIVGDVEENI
jgi:hypothetical protein